MQPKVLQLKTDRSNGERNRQPMHLDPNRVPPLAMLIVLTGLCNWTNLATPVFSSRKSLDFGTIAHFVVI